MEVPMPSVLVSNRRRSPRWPVQVLTRCTYLRGEKPVECRMWVKDVNESGLLLESVDPLPLDKPGAFRFYRGRRIEITHLFYDETGARGRTGTLKWAVLDAETDRWRVGVQFLNKEDLSSFQDFLKIVKAEKF